MKNKFINLTLLTCALLTWAVAAIGQDVAPKASDLKYGLYIHFGIATYANPGEQGQIPAERFAPTALDVKSWVHAAKEAGMTFAVLTAKHESGFCLWDSDGYGYDVAQSPYKGDIIGDFIAACNAEGIVPGLHYSIPDAYNEGGVRFRGPVSPVYFDRIKKQLTELHTRYPGIRIEILDGIARLSPDQLMQVSRLIRQLTPACLFFDNNRQLSWGPHCTDDSIIKGWMWKPQAQLNPAEMLFEHYSQSRQTGRSYVLNVGPDTTGRISDDQIAVLAQLKDMIANRPLTQSAAANPPAAQPAAADRLKQLKDLYDQGLITKDDYDKKVKAILDSM